MDSIRLYMLRYYSIYEYCRCLKLLAKFDPSFEERHISMTKGRFNFALPLSAIILEFLEFTCNCYHRSIVNFVRKNVEHCRPNFTSIFSFFAVWRYGRSSDFLNFGEISSFRNIEKTRCQLFHFCLK